MTFEHELCKQQWGRDARTNTPTFCRSSFTWRLSTIYASYKNGKEKSISFTFQYATRRLARTSPPTAPRRLSTLSTDTADSLTSLEKDARVKIQAYENQSLRDETPVKKRLECIYHAGRTALARDVIEISSNRKLYDVFLNLFTGLAAPILIQSGRSTSITVASTLDQPKQRDPSFAAQPQLRDSYRCVITGQLNTGQWGREGEPGHVFHGPTEGAHIIPFAGVRSAKRYVKYLDFTIQVFPALPEILSAEEINTLRNGIILRDSVHTQFGKLTIALKPTGIKNEYEVKTYQRYPPADISAIPSDRRVRLLPNTEYEIPSPAILDAHWRMCEIFNASAMGEAIERHLRDWEELRGSECAVVREDGTTDLASLLDIAL
ncbi:hypothetical protein N7463_005782 [Penicillium fimorum]|uniref:HNH nuclease domain-containing protein n=1 Tax=Penicillium fimorum TaxID=1882269 RepID=A0A9X0C5G0_9EURO|nr:hypothetical protein N7463_005782 [Penicillium fimorum]